MLTIAGMTVQLEALLVLAASLPTAWRFLGLGAELCTARRRSSWMLYVNGVAVAPEALDSRP